MEEQKLTQQRLGRILLDLGYITQSQLTEALAIQVEIERIDLSDISLSRQIIAVVPAELVNKYTVLPIWLRDGQLGVAMADPFDTQAIEDLQVVTGLEVTRYFGKTAEMERAILNFWSLD